MPCRTLLVLVALPLLAPAAALAADEPGAAPAGAPSAAPAAAPAGTPGASSWPRSLALEAGTAVIFQPQLEKLEGVTLTGRAAVSWEARGQEPVFGVFWFQAQLQIDKEKGTADVESLKVTRVRFPNITPEKEAQAVKTLETEIPKWDVSSSLDELQAALAVVARQQQTAGGLQSKPPRLIFSREPAVLLLYDGQPAVRPIPGSSLERVVNTKFFVARDPGTSRFYLSGGPIWYEAADPKGPWQPVASPSGAVKAFYDQNAPPPTPPPGAPPGAAPAPPGGAAPAPAGTPAPAPTPAAPSSPPRIIVATEPAELIVFDGAPNYVPVGKEGDLLYADNTDGKVLLHVPTNESFVLVSGRWFKAKNFEGPWAAVRSDKLPPAFAAIPAESDIGDLRTFVAGTDEAKDALADAQIPQTTAVKRDQKIEVTYDGEPSFKAIEGTKLAYATNSPYSVISDSGKYWCCHQGVWYVAAAPKGPWAVSDKRPPSIDQVPPSSPVYNTKYVYVYQSTPEVVYVGYLPAYTGVYPYYGSVVYGTGYYYPPYIGPTVCYPAPATFGVHMTFNPYTGFGVGVTYGTPFFSIGFHFGGSPYGWYGPYGYRPHPYPPYGYRPPPAGYRPPPGTAGGRPPGGAPPPAAGGGRPSGGAPPSASTQPAGGRPAGGGPSASTQPAGGRPSGGPSASTQPANLYNRPENTARNAPRDASAANRRPSSPSQQPNNVYGDRNGNVYRQGQGGGWEQHTGQGWQQPGGGARPSTTPSPSGGRGAAPSAQPRAAPAGLGNDAAARSRSMGGGSRGGGRGGGGRR